MYAMKQDIAARSSNTPINVSDLYTAVTNATANFDKWADRVFTDPISTTPGWQTLLAMATVPVRIAIYACTLENPIIIFPIEVVTELAYPSGLRGIGYPSSAPLSFTSLLDFTFPWTMASLDRGKSIGLRVIWIFGWWFGVLCIGSRNYLPGYCEKIKYVSYASFRPGREQAMQALTRLVPNPMVQKKQKGVVPVATGAPGGRIVVPRRWRAYHYLGYTPTQPTRGNVFVMIMATITASQVLWLYVHIVDQADAVRSSGIPNATVNTSELYTVLTNMTAPFDDWVDAAAEWKLVVATATLPIRIALYLFTLENPVLVFVAELTTEIVCPPDLLDGIQSPFGLTRIMDGLPFSYSSDWAFPWTMASLAHGKSLGQDMIRMPRLFVEECVAVVQTIYLTIAK